MSTSERKNAALNVINKCGFKFHDATEKEHLKNLLILVKEKYFTESDKISDEEALCWDVFWGQYSPLLEWC